MTTQSTDERQLEMLKAVADYDRPKLQESVFVKRYLHYFTGQAPVQLATAQWLEVAGSPFAEVDVYNGNEFLFRVPALLASNARTLDGLSNISVYRAAELVGAHYNVHPKLGDSKLHQLITSRLGNRPEHRDVIRRWNVIFQRYDIPLIPLEGEVTPKGEPIKQEPVQEDVWDDF